MRNWRQGGRTQAYHNCTVRFIDVLAAAAAAAVVVMLVPTPFIVRSP